MSSPSRHVVPSDMPDYIGKRSSVPYIPNQEELARLVVTSRVPVTSDLDLSGRTSNSEDNLLPVARSRSSSLIRLSDIKRNLSASNLAALSDSNLSIKKALPIRSYDAPNSTGSTAKLLFVRLVKRYYYQLTEGCGNEKCQNRFCYSCKVTDSKGFPCDVAAIISIRLASSQRHYLCKSISNVDQPLPQEVFQPSNGNPKPFLHTLFSTSPFKSLFTAQPQSVKGGSISQSDKRKDSSTSSIGVPSFTDAKPPTGARSKGPSPVRSKVSKSEGIIPKTFTNCSRDNQTTRLQDDVDMYGSCNSTNISMPYTNLVQQRRIALGHCSDSSIQHSAPNLAYGLQSGEADCSSEENLLVFHARSAGTPAGSQGNLSLSSSMSFGSGAPDTYPSMTSSPARLLSSQEALDETDDLRQLERSLSWEEGIGEFSLTHLTLPMLEGAIETYRSSADPSFLINTIRTVFTSPEALNASFRFIDGDTASPIDLGTVRQAYALLWTLTPLDIFLSTMTNALEILLMSLDATFVPVDRVNPILILLENPLLETPELLRILCHIIAHLSQSTRAALVRALSIYAKKHFQRLLHLIKNYLGSVLRPNYSNREHVICIAKVLSVLHDASSLAESHSKAHHKTVQLTTLKDYYSRELSRNMDYMSEFEKWKLGSQRREKRAAKVGCSSTSDSGFMSSEASSSSSSSMTCNWLDKETAATAREASNRHLDGAASSDHYQPNETQSLLDFPFLLDPASKVHIMHLDAVMQMRQEYQAAILHQARVCQAQRYLHSSSQTALKDSIKAAMCPFLVLEVRRDSLIRDTLIQMRLKHRDLKKPLKIKYVGGGEQGLDMGGLQKEFFQLITEAIFDPKYAMFTYLEESRTLWINGSSLESGDEFELVGSLLGLAIYNGINFDVHFPKAIYKKLHDQPMDLEDLMEIQPSLGQALQELLLYDRDVEDTFCWTFQISYTSLGELVTVDLLTSGSEIPVTTENREEFVRLYVQHLLVDSIAIQFEAFARGFHTVCGGAALGLFQAAETEMLVCGSPDLDFKALEASATYEDGYSKNHPTIRALWAVVHSLNNEQKKKLLHFITGSDRVPLKGLSSLPIVIQRNGPESDRLPTAMTCFNRLLLPAYGSQEALTSKLLVAIENSKGFGLT